MANPTPKVTLGQPVVYIGSKGKQKTAFVVGTPESVEEGTSLQKPNEDQLYITVWEFSAGHFVPKGPIPFEGSVADNDEFKNSDGVTVGVWRLPA